MSIALARALERERKAEDDVERVLRRDYPLGAQLKWKRGSLQSGVVLQHGQGDRIKVRNERTGREFWIYAFSVVEAQRAD